MRAPNLALFDFDGTITTTDTYSAFLRFSASPVRLAAGAIVLSPLMVGYRLGLIPSSRGRPLASSFAFRGKSAAAVRDAGRKYAVDVLPRVMRRRALERIDWHKRRGDTVVIVSASLDAYLEHCSQSLGVDVICTQLEERDGTLTGRYVDGDCCGAEKLRRIRERYDVGRYPLVYAYGDTDEDREMLDLAHVRYFRWKRIAGGEEETPEV
jgi:phosphatidylglycerophosphatase C